MKIFFMLILFTLSMFAHAGVYKWVDKDGQAHYSQLPPSKSAKEMDLPSTAINPKDREASQERIEKQQNFLKALGEDRQAQKKMEQEDEHIQQQKKEHEKYCTKLHHELRNMEIGGTVWYELDDKGERRFLSEQDVEERKLKLRKQIKDECLQ